MSEPSDGRVKHYLDEWSREATAKGDHPRFVEFAAAFLHRAGSRILQTHDSISLQGATRAAFDFSKRRAPGERLIRLRFPDELPGRAVIEILQDDRPFLVDTLRLTLRRHSLREQCLLHPTLAVERNAEGVLERVSSPESAGDSQNLRESFVYLEVFPRPGPEARDALAEDLADVMAGVANVTDDHEGMIQCLREMATNVDLAGRTLDVAADRSDKICRFLEWLAEDHFVLLGVRHYDAKATKGSWEVRIRSESSLGIWRDHHESRFDQAVRGDEIPPGLVRALDDSRIILISKGWVESRIHRAGRMDRILVKEHDASGKVAGFLIVSGLFTFAALRTPSSELPLLAERLTQILEKDGASVGSHRHKALVAAFDSAPMEFLFDASVDDNSALIREIVDAEGTEEPRVVLRTDASERAFYAAVIMPRGRYGESLRGGIRRLFERNPAVGFVDDRVSFLEEGSALLHFFCTMISGEVPNVPALEREIRHLASNWDDRLTDALITKHGAAEGGELAARYVDAFPEGLHATTHPADAVADIEGLEQLHASGEPQISLRVDRARKDAAEQMLRLYLQEEMLLSDLLPIIDCLGIRVVDARQVRVNALDRPTAFLHALRIEPLGASQADLDAIDQRLGDALRAVLGEVMPSDPLNTLILGAGLEWQHVDLLRSYAEYFIQVQSSLTRRFIRDVLLQNPAAARMLVQYHAARLGPEPDADRRRDREASLSLAFGQYRDRVENLNEDRTLGALFELIDATLRTNLFARMDDVGKHSHRIASKIDPSQVTEIRRPHAYREIFVHAPGMSGIHLRGGPVARGGLRWSDRLDDFRTEVLGLMRTQQLKNGLIVPVGAKGGFVLRKMGLTPQEARIAADEHYGVFIESLLDVTDNVDVEGRVIHPEGVHCRDGDDPYLVVAADKGTAHLSDTANAIAQARGFWLGDAFASGGSVGYDHKKYAITARGAWECVLHHFAEIGIDADTQSYSVIGIGDMSGDVFGNGLLLMRKARLVAAFDHRHIFIDPNPDPDPSWNERKRLFALPRSSWSDYDRAQLSAGGGIYPRSAKKIELSSEARTRLGIDTPTLTGPDLVRAILAAPVDVLWNGGIGTYVKASTESHADVGDRANEAVRIDAPSLRARVIGEGGNLGLTQAARVEAALSGVRLDTDAIHNSAGVDLSDHEVNYKILLAPAVRAGQLAESDRVAKLFEVADEACESVLAHNRAQALAISLDERRSQRQLDRFHVAIEVLCDSQGVSASEVGLPDEATLQQRKLQGDGLTRPELSALLGLAKLDLRLALAADAFVDANVLDALHVDYYPRALREVCGPALDGHRLRRQIIALESANRIIDVGGITAITNLVAKRGIAAPIAAAAWRTADAILDGARIRGELLSLRRDLSLASLYDSLIELDDAVQDVSLYLIAEGIGLQPTQQTDAWREALFGLSSRVDGFLSKGEATRYRERESRHREHGLPEKLAGIMAGAPLADRGLNILRLANGREPLPTDLAAAYAKLGDRSGINWVYQNLRFAPAEDVWDRIVLMDLRTEILALQRDLTQEAIRLRPEEPLLAVDDFLLSRAAIVARVRALIAGTAATPTASALAVVTQTLMRLDSTKRFDERN